MYVGQEETCSESEQAFAYSGLGDRQGARDLEPHERLLVLLHPLQTRSGLSIPEPPSRRYRNCSWPESCPRLVVAHRPGGVTGMIEKWSSGRASSSVCLGGFVWVGSLDLQGLWCKGACTETVETREVSIKIVCMVITEFVFGSWAQEGRWHRLTPCKGTVEGLPKACVWHPAPGFWGMGPVGHIAGLVQLLGLTLLCPADG